MPPVRFTGTTEAYVWLLVRGYALLAVTLGIYRFWLNTDVRRFLWSKTRWRASRWNTPERRSSC